MVLFKKEPAKKKKPAKSKSVSLMDRIKTATEEATAEWLNKHFSYSHQNPVFDVTRVRAYVYDSLADKVETLILNACGLEEASFNRGWKVAYKSPLEDVIAKTAKEDAIKAIEKWRSTNTAKLPSALPEKYKKAIEAEYEREYMDAALGAAKELATAKAQEDIDAILVGVLKK